MINVIAPAKLNLFLRICGKNNAGYHLIDSLVAFTEYGDTLTIHSAEKDELVLTGEFAGKINTPIRNNLVIRALNAFRQGGGNIGPLRIILEKKYQLRPALVADQAMLQLYFLLSMGKVKRHLVKKTFLTLA